MTGACHAQDLALPIVTTETEPTVRGERNRHGRKKRPCLFRSPSPQQDGGSDCSSDRDERLDAQQACSEIKLRAERRAGELLREMREKGERKSRGKPEKKTRHDDGFTSPTLSTLGITETQATRWQRESLVPESAFEAYVATTRAKGDELTQAGLLRLAKPEC